MTERRWLLGSLLLLVAGGAVVFLLGGDGGASAPSDLLEVDSSTPISTGPVLRGSRGASAPRSGRVQAGEGVRIIRGRVVDLAGAPLAGRVVRVLHVQVEHSSFRDLSWEAVEQDLKRPRVYELRQATVSSVDDGSFEIAGLDFGQRYRLVVDTRNGEFAVPGECFDHEAPPGRVQRLVVGRGVPFAGRVVDAEGRGLEAWVSMHMDGENEEVEAAVRDWRSGQVHTAPDGGFAYAGVPPGELHVDVIVEGHFRLGCFAVRAPSETTVIVRPRNLGTAVLVGLVRSASGTPVADARILLSLNPGEDHAGWAAQSGRSDEEGAYRFEGLPAGKIATLSVSTQEHGSVAGLHEDLSLRAGAVVRADVDLPQTSALSGRTEGPRGTPLAGIAVVLSQAEGAFPSVLARTTSDEAGRFVFPHVGQGVFELHAWGKGWGQRRPGANEIVGLRKLTAALISSLGQRVQVETGVPSENVRLRLERGAVLQGRALGADGAPVPDAAIMIEPEKTLFPAARGEPRHLTTGADGAYLVEGLDPQEEWVLRASAGGFRSRLLRVIPSELEPGSATDLTLLPVQRVTGRVLDAEDAPVPGLEVEIKDLEIEGETGEDGSFVLEDVPHGEHTLSISPSRVYLSDPGTEDVQVGPGPTGPLTLRWSAVHRVAGIVVNEEGMPCVEVKVRFRTEGGPSWSGRSATTDRQGRFEMRWLEAGPYQVLIDNDELEGRVEVGEVEAGEVDLRLVRPGGLRRKLVGALVDPDGRPLGEGRVRAFASADMKGAVLDRDVPYGNGRFELELPRELETVSLIVEHGLRGNGVADLSPRHVVRDLPLGGGEPIRIVVPLGLMLRGRVLSEDGQAIPDASIQVLSTSSGAVRSYGKSLRSARCDREGRFSFAGMGAGITVLKVLPKGEFAGLASVEVEAGEKEILLRLEQGYPLEVELCGPQGEPLADRALEIAPVAGGSSIPLRADPKRPHHYRSQRVPRGAYRIQIAAGRGYLALDQLVELPSPRVALSLPAAFWIRGRIEHEEASLVAVEFRTEVPGNSVGLSHFTHCDDKGEFEFHLLPSVRGVIYATIEELDLYALARDVQAPSRSIGLTLQQGARLRGRIEHSRRAGGWVSIIHASGLSWFEPVSDEGRFEIRAVPPGSCTCTWELDGVVLTATGMPGGADLILR